VANFYHNKRVLVLGGAGFLGSHFCPLLGKTGAKVTAIDDFSRGDNTRGRVSFVRFDLSVDQGATNNLFAYYNPHIVFNLAAHVAGVIYNQSNHLEMFTKNLALQTVPLLAAIESGVDRFVQVSSACVYAPEHNHPATEENGHLGEPVPANVGYSLAKRMGERLAVWAHRERGMHTVIVRPSNLVGERDYFDDRAHVVPALIRKCLEQDPIQFYGDGSEVREFLYAGDCAEGLMAAGEHGRAGDAYNLGALGETTVTIRELFNVIRMMTNTEFKDVEVIESHDPGDPKRWSSGLKAVNDLGWAYSISIPEMLERTVKWYNEQL
jgi:nucleoside-diphosphate-sugar epimerase